MRASEILFVGSGFRLFYYFRGESRFSPCKPGGTRAVRLRAMPSGIAERSLILLWNTEPFCANRHAPHIQAHLEPPSASGYGTHGATKI